MPSWWAEFSPIPLLPAPDPEPAQQDATPQPLCSLVAGFPGRAPAWG